MIKTVLFAAAAAVTTLATAAPALAKDVPVFYGDLDLTTAKGQSALTSRIHRAARKACNFESEGRIPGPDAMACYHKARANAQTEVASRLDKDHLGG